VVVNIVCLDESPKVPQRKNAGFVEPMDCVPFSKLPEGSKRLWKLKLDGGRVRYFVFDLLCHKGRDLTGLPLIERWKILGTLTFQSEWVRIAGLPTTLKPVPTSCCMLPESSNSKALMGSCGTATTKRENAMEPLLSRDSRNLLVASP